MSHKSSIKPYYMMVCFWGETFREYFYSFCLRTLLSQNNIPRLVEWPGSKFLIATTTDDWVALRNRPLFELLKVYVEPVLIDIGYPETQDEVQIHMSKGHRLAAEIAWKDKVYAGYYAPDLLVSDGTIAFLQRMSREGKQAILTPAIRYAKEPVLKELDKLGAIEQIDCPLNLPPRILAKIAQISLHSEIQRYEFESLYFGDYPIWSYWRVPDKDAFIIHTVSWALLLGDYSVLPKHSDRMLNDSTIDGFYVYKNFFKRIPSHRFYLSGNSDDTVFMSLTPESELSFYPLISRSINNSKRAYASRLNDIHKFLHGNEIDAFRRWAYTFAHVVHANDDLSFAEFLTCKTTNITLEALNLPRSELVAHSIYKFTFNSNTPEENFVKLIPYPCSWNNLLKFLINSRLLLLKYLCHKVQDIAYQYERKLLVFLFGRIVSIAFRSASRDRIVYLVKKLPKRYRRSVLKRISRSRRYVAEHNSNSSLVVTTDKSASKDF